jgi:hypothetical protein
MSRYVEKGTEYDKNLLITGEDREEVSDDNALPVKIIGIGTVDVAVGVFNSDLDKVNSETVEVGEGTAGSGTQRVSVSGTAATGITQESGGVGAIGWLSSIKDYLKTLAGTVTSGRIKNIEKIDPVVTNATGAAAIATSYAPAAPAYLENITVHLSAAPTTAGSLTITLNANDGAAYDTLMRSESMVGLTDFVYQPDRPILIENGDAIAVAYANADTKTYGLRIVARVMS